MADPVPKELKPAAPFVQRARELEGRDPVIHYYCLYHAANVAMKLSPTADDSRAFLLNLLDQLESLKASLSDQEAITNDIVAQAYVTNFADRVFVGADNEDRQGNASRATAKKFLAASNFLELLADFGPLEEDVQERIRYSKWKASDIAKALKEGRQPIPGNGTNLEDQQAQEDDPPAIVDSVSQTTGLENAEPQQVSSAAPDSTGLEEPPASKTESEKEVELALLSSQAPPAVTATNRPASSLGEPSSPTPTNGHPAQPLPEPPSDPLSSFPSAVLPSVPSENSAPSSPPLTTDIPPALTTDLPSAPSLDIPPAHSPERMHTPVSQEPPVIPRPSVQRTYHAPTTVAAGSPPPPLPVAHPHAQSFTLGSTPQQEPDAPLDPKIVTQTQKHAKFAISALNYDDVIEAKKQLRQALALLGG